MEYDYDHELEGGARRRRKRSTTPPRRGKMGYEIERGTGVPEGYRSTTKEVPCDDVYFYEKRKEGGYRYWYPDSCVAGATFKGSLSGDSDFQGVKDAETARAIIKKFNQVRQIRFYNFLIRLSTSLAKQYMEGDDATRKRISARYAKVKVKIPTKFIADPIRRQAEKIEGLTGATLEGGPGSVVSAKPASTRKEEKKETEEDPLAEYLGKQIVLLPDGTYAARAAGFKDEEVPDGLDDALDELNKDKKSQDEKEKVAFLLESEKSKFAGGYFAGGLDSDDFKDKKLRETFEIELYVPKNLNEIPEDLRQIDVKMLIVDPFAAEEIKMFEDRAKDAAFPDRRPAATPLSFVMSNKPIDRRFREQLRGILMAKYPTLFNDPDANKALYNRTDTETKRRLKINDDFAGQNYFGWTSETNALRRSNMSLQKDGSSRQPEEENRINRLLRIAASKIYADTYYRTAKRAIELTMTKSSNYASLNAACTPATFASGDEASKFYKGLGWTVKGVAEADFAREGAFTDFDHLPNPFTLKAYDDVGVDESSRGACLPFEVKDRPTSDPLLAWWNQFAYAIRPVLKRDIELRNARLGLGKRAAESQRAWKTNLVRKAREEGAGNVAKALAVLDPEIANMDT